MNGTMEMSSVLPLADSVTAVAGAVVSNSFFELGMLLCFGVCWPVSLYKTYTTKRTEGKSLLFLLIILAGYASGFVHKILYSRDLVIILYVSNFIMVLVDLLLCLRYSRRAAPAA